MEWNGVYQIDIDIDITAIYMKHDTTKKPTKQPTKEHDATTTTTTTIYSRYTFMMIPPSFEKDNVFFLDGWMENGEKERRERERDRERKREREERELYNVEKMNLETKKKSRHS